MNGIIKGADIHAGDGEYSIGTQEEYEEFVKAREEHFMLQGNKMNERIEELEKQATTVVEGWSDECGTTRYYEFDRRKFAELIIKECAQQAHDLADVLSMHRDRSGAEIAESIGNTIKEHFGVGMSIEDKKNLIKGLLGVKND